MQDKILIISFKIKTIFKFYKEINFKIITMIMRDNKISAQIKHFKKQKILI